MVLMDWRGKSMTDYGRIDEATFAAKPSSEAVIAIGRETSSA
jgi:hypothetical protein